jgi:hypothetical protein
MSQDLRKIEAVHQAARNFDEEYSSRYNKTIWISTRLQGEALEVSFSTLVNPFQQGAMNIPANRMEERAVREKIIFRTVDLARQTIAEFLEEVSNRAALDLDSKIKFRIFENSEKFHVEPVRAAYNNSLMQFRYKAYFQF